MHRASVVVSLALLIVSMLGCDSDKSDSSVAGVPRERALKDVSQSDLTALCKANEEKLESLGSCTVMGLENKTQTECEAVMSSCEKDDAKESSSDIDCNGASTEGLEDCNLTVGEFADCLDELERYLTALSCKDAGKTITPPACFQSLSDKCASLFE
jgi:hypothetical protein